MSSYDFAGAAARIKEKTLPTDTLIEAYQWDMLSEHGIKELLDRLIQERTADDREEDETAKKGITGDRR